MDKEKVNGQTHVTDDTGLFVLLLAVLTTWIVGLDTRGIDVLVVGCGIVVFEELGGNGVTLLLPVVDPLLTTGTTGGVDIVTDGVGITTELGPLLGIFVVETTPAPPPPPETGPPTHT